MPFENSEGFTIFFRNRLDKKLRVFEPDENGYVYVPLNEGQYYISMIEYYDFQGRLRIPVRQSSTINIDASDIAVNIGIIRVNLQQDESSRITYLTNYAYPYAVKLIPSSQKPELKIAQISEWDVIRQYISSKFDISSESIRDEVIRFPAETDNHSE